MRRSYRGSQVGTASPSVSRQRSDYLFILRNLQNHDEFFSRALGLLGVIASEEEIIQLCEENDFQPAAQAEVKASCLSDRSELFDRLAYLMPQKFGSTERTKLKLARNLVSILCKKTHARLCWQENAFLRYLRDNLGLSVSELQLLWALYLQQASRELDFLNVGIGDLAEELHVLQVCFGNEEALIGELLLRDSKLITTGLIENNGDVPKIAPRVILAIAGQISLSAFQTENFVKDQSPVYDLDSFDLNPIDIQIMLSLLKGKGPANILLYGKPGCGKTEAARSLIRAAGLEVMNIPVQATGGRYSRLTRVRYADHFSNGCGIIVDEAELILNNAVRYIAFESDSTPSKSVLNTYLDSSRSKTIWILNEIDHLHESTLRRFHFKLHFEKLSRKQREQAFELVTQKHSVESRITRSMKDKILSNEHISPGHLDRMAHALVATQAMMPEISSDSILSRLLHSNMPLHINSCDDVSVNDKYSLDALNLSLPVEEIIKTLTNFLILPKRPRNGLNLVFHGLPGTGKTEFARYLARHCGKDLLIKRGSDLLGMYVGNTEKSIAAAFRQAQGNEAILLIDEADTFFRSRENARQNYEISHTNEFLNQMENHNTILICCTNMLDHFDKASLRRFHEKIEFKPIPVEKLRSVFLTCFSDLLSTIPRPAELDHSLRTLTNMTAGDFRSIERSLRLRGSAVPLAYILEQLKTETASRNRAVLIGFR